MTFSPVIPISGYGGWKLLERTMDRQKAAFEAVPTYKRDEDYFRAKIGTIDSADELIADRRLLGVALGAFGLDNDIKNKAFIRKVLEEGTLKDGTFANRLADKQYEKLSAAFGFGDYKTPRTQLSGFADEILSAYKTRKFEAAVGEQNDDMRLALNAQRELKTLSKSTSSEDTKWFTVMGSSPLRKVFETALGLPSSFGSLDLDQQLSVFKSRADRVLGDDGISQFSDPAKVENLIKQFLIRSEAASSSSGNLRSQGILQLIQVNRA